MHRDLNKGCSWFASIRIFLSLFYKQRLMQQYVCYMVAQIAYNVNSRVQ